MGEETNLAELRTNMTPNNSASALGQVQDSSAVSRDQRKRAVEDSKHHYWLYRLATLPPAVYRRAIDRFIRDDTLTSLARWVMGTIELGIVRTSAAVGKDIR